jgi:hypothetical protein
MKRLFYVAAAVLAVIGLGFVVDRVAFLSTAEHTTGEVTHIAARDSTCGGGRRRRSHPCTKFDATVTFTAAGAPHTVQISAGRAPGTGQDVAHADFRVGDPVPVVHAPSGSPAYKDSASGVWGTPMMTLFLAVAAGIGGMFKKDEG